MELIIIILSWNQNNALGESIFFFSEHQSVAEILRSNLRLSKFAGVIMLARLQYAYSLTSKKNYEGSALNIMGHGENLRWNTCKHIIEILYITSLLTQWFWLGVLM